MYKEDLALDNLSLICHKTKSKYEPLKLYIRIKQVLFFFVFFAGGIFLFRL